MSLATGEEAAFAQTLSTGSVLFDTAALQTKKSGGTIISGEKAFALHDTYGFPIDLTMEMASEAGLQVDRERFTELMQEQRSRAKADSIARKSDFATSTAYKEILTVGGTTEFTGYMESMTEAHITGLVIDGVSVPAAGVGDNVELILDRTPFYAESGGQVGDQGSISTSNCKITIKDTLKKMGDLHVHIGKIDSGKIKVGQNVNLEINTNRRNNARAYHSATHLLHEALRRTLGKHVTQKGSLVSSEKLRFDFSHTKALSNEELISVESKINMLIEKNSSVSTDILSYDDAVKKGALALFGEKYDDEVRVLSMGEDSFSVELCGGTHVDNLSEIGSFKLIAQSSVASGIRRIEAVTGSEAKLSLSIMDKISVKNAEEKEKKSKKTKSLKVSKSILTGELSEINGKVLL